MIKKILIAALLMGGMLFAQGTVSGGGVAGALGGTGTYSITSNGLIDLSAVSDHWIAINRNGEDTVTTLYMSDVHSQSENHLYVFTIDTDDSSVVFDISAIGAHGSGDITLNKDGDVAVFLLFTNDGTDSVWYALGTTWASTE